MDSAWIKSTVTANPLGRRESITYKLVGESPYVRFDRRFLQSGDIKKIKGEEEIQIGPYRLLKMESGVYWDYVLYVRKDKFGAFRVWFYKSTRLLDLIYRRLIITLAVWRLADYSQGFIPSWRDIRILKRLKHG